MTPLITRQTFLLDLVLKTVGVVICFHSSRVQLLSPILVFFASFQQIVDLHLAIFLGIVFSPVIYELNSLIKSLNYANCSIHFNSLMLSKCIICFQYLVKLVLYLYFHTQSQAILNYRTVKENVGRYD